MPGCSAASHSVESRAACPCCQIRCPRGTLPDANSSSSLAACRRDSIDASHYPVFHQMEGVRVFSDEEVQASGMTGKQLADQELQETLQGLAKHLFGEGSSCRLMQLPNEAQHLPIFASGLTV